MRNQAYECLGKKLMQVPHRKRKKKLTLRNFELNTNIKMNITDYKERLK